jgi:undecaprenyl diphosphate synthase
MQSALRNGTHVAIIMDGNRRWAAGRGLSHVEGHEAGAEALRHIVQAAPGHGIATLTVYAFASENWRRPGEESAAMMRLFSRYLDSETEALVRDGIRLSVIGRRDRLGQALIAEVERSESATEWGDAMHLRLAVDYSARAAIVDAARRTGPGVSAEEFASQLSGECGDVDFLIRTANDHRLSDFLLWECAYAELYFTPCLWPDFGEKELASALQDFRTRKRAAAHALDGKMPHDPPVNAPALARFAVVS